MSLLHITYWIISLKVSWPVKCLCQCGFWIPALRVPHSGFTDLLVSFDSPDELTSLRIRLLVYMLGISYTPDTKGCCCKFSFLVVSMEFVSVPSERRNLNEVKQQWALKKKKQLMAYALAFIPLNVPLNISLMFPSRLSSALFLEVNCWARKSCINFRRHLFCWGTVPSELFVF